MAELSSQIKLEGIKLYLEGCSFDEIAGRLHIAKGSVSNIVNEFKAGRIPEAAGLAEHAELLRVEQASKRAIQQEEECQEKEAYLEELSTEIQQKEARKAQLDQAIAQREQREATLVQRIQGLEERAYKNDAYLARARKYIGRIGKLGLKLEDLSAVTERITGIAHRHNIPAAELRDRLFAELESLDEGLSLDSCIQQKRLEVAKLEKDVEGLASEKQTLTASLRSLQKQRARLEGFLGAIQEKTYSQLEEAGRKVAASLRDGEEAVLQQLERRMSDTVEVIRHAARVEAQLQAREWLRDLVALVDGKSTLQPQRIRTLALALLEPLQTWLRKNMFAVPSDAVYGIDMVVAALRGWTTWQTFPSGSQT